MLENLNKLKLDRLSNISDSLGEAVQGLKNSLEQRDKIEHNIKTYKKCIDQMKMQLLLLITEMSRRTSEGLIADFTFPHPNTEKEDESDLPEPLEVTTEKLFELFANRKKRVDS